MTNIVLNEKACAEYALENLILGSKPTETLGRVARYYYSIGYKKKEIGSLLEDFMLKCDPTINIVKWQATIDKQVSSADTYTGGGTGGGSAKVKREKEIDPNHKLRVGYKVGYTITYGGKIGVAKL